MVRDQGCSFNFKVEIFWKIASMRTQKEVGEWDRFAEASYLMAYSQMINIDQDRFAEE